MSDAPSPRIHWLYPVLLIVTGALGWFAAFNLTLDKFAVLENPDAALSCNVNVFIQCGKNLDSWQGSLLGFPNPILGLGGFVAPIAVGVALLAGAHFARWFWIAFNVGVLAAFVFCVWLFTQSFFVLQTLCLWCFLVWIVTTPLFVGTTALNLSRGVWTRSPAAQRVGAALVRFAVPIVVVLYLALGVTAELRFHVIEALANL